MIQSNLQGYKAKVGRHLPTHITMSSQNENQVTNWQIGSVAYYHLVKSLSFGLCYGGLDSTWCYLAEHMSSGFSLSLFYASLHVLRLVQSP